MHYHFSTRKLENVLHVLPCGQEICIVLTEIEVVGTNSKTESYVSQASVTRYRIRIGAASI